MYGKHWIYVNSMHSISHWTQSNRESNYCNLWLKNKAKYCRNKQRKGKKTIHCIFVISLVSCLNPPSTIARVKNVLHISTAHQLSKCLVRLENVSWSLQQLSESIEWTMLGLKGWVCWYDSFPVMFFSSWRGCIRSGLFSLKVFHEDPRPIW